MGVTRGLAWAFVKYSGDYVRHEAEAKASKRGVWSMVCSAPWDFRKARWEENGLVIDLRGNTSLVVSEEA